MNAVKSPKQRCPLRCSRKPIKNQELVPIAFSLIREDELPTVSEVVDMCALTYGPPRGSRTDTLLHRYCEDFGHEVVRQHELFAKVQANIIRKSGRLATQEARIEQLRQKVKRDRRGVILARIQALRERIAQEYDAITRLHENRIRLLVALREVCLL